MESNQCTRRKAPSFHAHTRGRQEIPIATLKKAWPGHHPITAFVLEAVAKKWSADATVIPSRAEQVFFVAASFWAAIAMETLDDFVQPDVRYQLQNAKEACIGIGAPSAAAVVQHHVNRLSPYPNELEQRRVVADLQREFIHTDENMDVLLARYAADCVRKGLLPS